MLHIDILCVGKIKEPFLKEALIEYKKRISKYCILSIIELEDEKVPISPSNRMIESITKKESDLIYSHIKKNSFIICLDLNGKQFTSEKFAEHLESITCSGYSHISFIIGGTLGIHSSLKQSAHECICFSKMTFPHQLIRIFLLEQIFRAFKISNNETYHR